MAAALLAVELPRSNFQLMIVPSEGSQRALDPFGSIVAGDPSMRRFHARLGLPESVLLQSSASFNLGVAYAGWSSHRPAYFSPFGDIGATLGGAAFHQHIARLRDRGGHARIGDFSLATLLAQAGRFCHPSDDPASPLSTFSYGMHIEQSAYCRILFDIARRNGAELLDRGLAQVALDASGMVETLLLDGGERRGVDLVIDASGAVIGEIGSGWESWRGLLHCDRSAVQQRVVSDPPSPYSLAAAHQTGWLRTVPCQGLVCETLVYSSDALDQAGAEQALAERSKSSAPAAHFDFVPGRRTAPWSKNCVAIGSAASVLEPLHPLALLLIHNSIERLLRLFPSGPSANVEAREFNRETIDELDRARDLVLLRYLINDRAEPFWNEARAAQPPPDLERKMAAYRSRGMVPMVDGDQIDEADWALIFDEHGIRPKRYDVLADAIPSEQLTGLLDRMRGLLTSAAAAQPRHGEYLSELRQRAAA